MNKRIVSVLIALIAVASTVLGQGANNIKISEVMTRNGQSVQDEYGERNPWVEIVNTAYSTYNIRGMYITTDKAVLDKKMSAPDRMKRMSIIPNGEERTNLKARQHIVLQLNSQPAKGKLHLTVPVKADETMWIALYDGNAVDLIDSVTVPVLKADCSYALTGDAAQPWEVKAPEAVTPGIDNSVEYSLTKADKLKREDPHGFGITVLCMGIVFACLALLYGFFAVFGYVADRRNKIAKVQPIKPIVTTGKKLNEMRHATSNILQDGLETKGRDKEIYIAVISMALQQYLDDVHDVESGVLTIVPHHTTWGEHSTFNNI